MPTPFVVVTQTNGFLTTLEQFEMKKVPSASTSQFSEVNLNLAVYDDTEKKLPPIKSVRTARTSLREMLIDGVFESQSQAIVNMTIKHFADQARARDHAKKKALLSKLKLKTKTDMQLTKIKKYMAALAIQEKKQKVEQRRLDMGLPANFKLKKPLEEVKVIRRFKNYCAANTRAKEALKLPKIEEGSLDPEVLSIANESEDDSDLDATRSYGNFLYKKLGRKDATNSSGSFQEKSSHISLPTIDSDFSELSVPSRPPPRSTKSIKVPEHLERFRYMRLKN